MCCCSQEPSYIKGEGTPGLRNDREGWLAKKRAILAFTKRQQAAKRTHLRKCAPTISFKRRKWKSKRWRDLLSATYQVNGRAQIFWPLVLVMKGVPTWVSDTWIQVLLVLLSVCPCSFQSRRMAGNAPALLASQAGCKSNRCRNILPRVMSVQGYVAFVCLIQSIPTWYYLFDKSNFVSHKIRERKTCFSFSFTL